MRISDWSSDVCSSDLEQMQAAPEIGRVFGHGCLFLRPCANSPALLPGLATQVQLQLCRAGWGFSGDVLCADEALPIATASLSLVYVQHVLESRSEEHTSELQSLMGIS